LFVEGLANGDDAQRSTLPVSAGAGEFHRITVFASISMSQSTPSPATAAEGRRARQS